MKISILFYGLTNGKYGNKDHKAWNKLVETLEIISPLSSGPKYEQYGCYCFQKGLYSSHFTGRGTPVDAIDQACFKFHQCQRCLGIDNGGSCTHNFEYSIQYGDELYSPDATCLDRPGTCGHNLCSCVIQFAKNIAQAESENAWNLAHSKWSPDRASLNCDREHKTTTYQSTTTPAPPSVNQMDLLDQLNTELNSQLPVLGENDSIMFEDNSSSNFESGDLLRGVSVTGADDEENGQEVKVEQVILPPVRARLVAPEVSLKRVQLTDDDKVYEDKGLQLEEIQYEYNDYTSTTSTLEITTTGTDQTDFTTQTQTDPTTTTELNTEAPLPSELCCGNYDDHRFPYYTAHRGCCNGKTFDLKSKQCCDGKIKDRFTVC